MAALTMARQLALFRCLEVPYATSQVTLISPRNMAGQPYTMEGSARAAFTQIQNWLTSNVYTNADLQTALEALLDLWIAMGVNTTSITGAVGALQGVAFDPRQKREEIRKQVADIVPFFREHERLQNAQGRSLNIEVMN